MRRTIALLLFDEVEVLDFAGPFEVFAAADELHERSLWQTLTVGLAPGTVRAVHGLKVIPEFTLENCPRPHVLVVPGGAGTRALLRQTSLLEWVRRTARQAEVVFSVCTGALVLAQAGLLDGLTVTTHHDAIGLLRSLAPTATVDASRRFHDHGRILTAAGISAGLDAALHLVARLASPAIADRTARHMEYGAHAQRAAAP